jgi:phage FluMu protein Com
MVRIIGQQIEESEKKTVDCLKCGRPLMDKDNFSFRKKCPSCGTVNRVTLGKDMHVYQFEEPERVTKKYHQEEDEEE